MYGKIFSSMYDGTLYGQWEAIVTFQQMIVLADYYGVVDMTPPAIAARTSIPLDIIEKGITALMQDDRYSRSTNQDGKRIVLMDESRPWGWQIVNYEYYRNLASREDKKQKDRERLRDKRSNQRLAGDSGLSLNGFECAYCDCQANTEDHIIPLSCGGSDSQENIVPACNRCNSSKSNRELNDFLSDPVIKINFEKIYSNPKLMRHIAICRNLSLDVANVAHIDVDVDVDKDVNKEETHIDRFDEFWSVYPKKVGKETALKAWQKGKFDMDMIINDIKNRIANHDQWENKQYIPNASKYLNQKLWTDEIIRVPETKKKSTVPFYKNEKELDSWARQHGVEAKRGDSYQTLYARCVEYETQNT